MFHIGSYVGQFHVGLFQTCFDYRCIGNQYGDENNLNSSPPILARRLFNAGPLAIVGIFLQLNTCYLCFLTAFIYIPPKPWLTCYLTPLLIFIAFIFQLSTLGEASYGIYLNGQSSVVFETALVFQIIALGLAISAADRIHRLSKIEYV